MKTRKDVIKRASKKLKMTQQSLIKITNVLDEVIKEIVVDEKEELKLANLVEIKPVYKESKVVCLCDKIISIYEFFRYQVNLSMNVTLILFVNLMK